ncbi:MAG: hypothetical protein HKN87_23710 [Saprospiraceae bacterium]|nr:hypothetical protein [Saprospiraceae bacterium]
MKLIYSLSLLFILSACSESDQSSGSNAAESDDFEAFYQRFHADSLFQMEHIAFPLAGLPIHADSLEDARSFFWQEDNWVLHRAFDERLTGYERSRKRFGSNIIIETIVQKDTDIGMIRRFAKMDDEWILIYYAAMNQFEPNN